jgi:hypothetical protein
MSSKIENQTDKTKPWLTAAHPEAIACEAAGKELYNELDAKGVDLTGVGVGISVDNQRAVIHINVRTSKDKDAVPTTYKNYEVEVIITGDIVLY